MPTPTAAPLIVDTHGSAALLLPALSTSSDGGGGAVTSGAVLRSTAAVAVEADILTPRTAKAHSMGEE